MTDFVFRRCLDRESPPLTFGLRRRASGRRRLVLESLEERVVLDADFAMLGATAIDPASVVAQYQVIEQPIPGDVPLKVYRSGDRVLDPADILIGRTTLTGASLAVGSHTATVNLDGPLVIDPSLRYVLVVAETGDANAANDAASFRKWIVGAVTHGVEVPPNFFPPWVTQLAASIEAQGYDEVLAYDWSDLSGLPTSEAPTLAAQRLAAQLGSVIQALPGFLPGDTVDVHLVGHSRGGGMITQTAAILPTDSAPLQGGYLKLSLLDPHPTRNTNPPNYSASTGPIGQYTATLFVLFQDMANDPPLTIPANVDRAEVFYQHATVIQTFVPDERIVNSWGVVPAAGNVSVTVYYDVTTQMPSHYGVHDLYAQVVVPTLGNALPVPIPSVPRPQPPVGGGPAFPNGRIGTVFEQSLLRQAGVPRPSGTHLLRGFGGLNLFIARQQPRAISFQITRLERFLVAQRGRTIPAAITDSLLLGLQQGRFLLLGQIPATTRVGMTQALARASRS